MRTLYISDLDGTLFGADSRLSDETVRLVNEAIDRGADFSIATARTPATVSMLLDGLKLRLPIAVLTGAVLWNPVNKQYSEPKFIDEETVRRLIDVYQQNQLPVFVFTLCDDHILHIYHLGPLSPQEKQFIEERLHSPYKRFHVPDHGTSVLPDRLDNVLLFYSIEPTEPARKVYDVVSSLDAPINPLFYHDIYGPEIAVLEIFSEAASKADAAVRIAAIADCDRIVAFGDNVNDLPVLERADLGVAVGNAIEEVLEKADLVIGSNLNDSVPKYILSDLNGN